MKYAFFSDVHANLEALQAVLDDMRKEGVDKIFFLGDAVGYGPNPNECVELINQVAGVKLMGNHDWVVLGRMDTTYFNPHAQRAIEWTIKQLTEQTKEIMAGFKLNYTLENDSILMVHSTPQKPEEWGYILETDEAGTAFSHFQEQICLIGHSHIPAVFYLKEGENSPELSDSAAIFRIKPGFRYIVNVGAVGQPRDGDSKACYIIHDTETGLFRYKRVRYAIRTVQAKMAKAGLPGYLINRLAQGK